MTLRALQRTGLRPAWLLCLLALAFRPAPAAAAPPELSEIVDKIEQAYQKTDDLQAAFTQNTKYEGFATPYASKGVLFVRRPGQMRWDYREPSHHQIYVNENVVIYVVPEHRQAIRSTLDREVNSTVPLGLLSGAARLSEQFAVAWADQPGADGGAYHLRLTGKEAAATLVPLSVTIDSRTFLIRDVTLHDPSGATTVFAFSDMKINGGLDPALFTFVPGEGIDLVDAPPMMPPGTEPKDEITPQK